MPVAKPQAVHCRKNAYDVYIGRNSKWGNPYSHLEEGTARRGRWVKTYSAARFTVATRKEAIAKYREYLLASPALMADLHELRGKVLGCWCKPLACHGDVLVELANR